MASSDYMIEPIESAPFGEMTLCRVACRIERKVLVVDPGFDVPAILEVLSREGLTVVAILNTHGHVDHIAGNAAMKEAFPSNT